MANEVEKFNTIAIGNLEKINTIAGSNIEDLNTLEFSQYTPMNASGGNSTLTSGNYKISVFTSSGTFTVNTVGDDGGTVQYLVIAGGGSGGGANGGAGGGGAGGYRTATDSWTVRY